KPGNEESESASHQALESRPDGVECRFSEGNADIGHYNPSFSQRQGRDSRPFDFNHLCRTTSNINKAPATPAFRDCTRPAIGNRTRSSQRAFTRRLKPFPSLPTTMAKG